MPSEPFILAFDTSAAHCAAALLCGDRIIASAHEEMPRGQAERLMPMIEEVMAQDGLPFEALDAVAVGTGPGNFTGIRIAVSAARGLALGLGLPAIGVSGFEALHAAHARPGERRHLVSLAGRDGYRLQELRDGRPVGEPRILPRADPSRDAPPLDDPVETLVLGENAGDVAYLFELSQNRPIHYRDAALPTADIAAWIARVARDRIGEDLPRPAPLYIRAADAAPARDAPPVILDDA